MNCKKCGGVNNGKAVINLRQHHMGLCKEHFLEWIPEQTERFIKKYRMFAHSDRVLVAVSGGKDSLSLWEILARLGYQADGLYIGLGIDGGIQYSSASRRLTERFAADRNLRLHIVDIAGEYGEGVPEIARRTNRGREKPCSVCGVAKRHIMNRVGRDGGYSVLATGHNLDDEAATLLGNSLNWKAGHLTRQSPVLEATHSGVVRKVKPLCRIYEREMAAYALLRGIEYIYEECPYSQGANSILHKEMLNQLETARPGGKLIFYLNFLKARQNGLFTAQADPELEHLHACPSCGQPTTAPSECAFCCMLHKTSR